MRIAAPTITPGALLVGVGVLVGGILLVRIASAASKAAGQAYDAAKDAAWAITPWNNDNVFAGTIDQWLFDGQTTIGGFLYDVTKGSGPVTPEQTRGVVNATNQAPVTYDWSASTPGRTSDPTFTITPNR